MLRDTEHVRDVVPSLLMTNDCILLLKLGGPLSVLKKLIEVKAHLGPLERYVSIHVYTYRLQSFPGSTLICISATYVCQI